MSARTSLLVAYANTKLAQVSICHCTAGPLCMVFVTHMFSAPVLQGTVCSPKIAHFIPVEVCPSGEVWQSSVYLCATVNLKSKFNNILKVNKANLWH